MEENQIQSLQRNPHVAVQSAKVMSNNQSKEPRLVKPAFLINDWGKNGAAAPAKWGDRFQ